MSTELKPCPFCDGGKPFISYEADSDGMGEFVSVKCGSCGAQSRQHFASNGNTCPQFFAEVREAWNRRTTQSAPIPMQAEERQASAVDGLTEAIKSLRNVERWISNEMPIPTDGCLAKLKRINAAIYAIAAIKAGGQGGGASKTARSNGKCFMTANRGGNGVTTEKSSTLPAPLIP